MNVPAKSHSRWNDIVTGQKTFELKFLAAKILLGRVVLTVSTDPSPENINKAVSQLHSLYERNAASPSVQQDLKTIFGEVMACRKI